MNKEIINFRLSLFSQQYAKAQEIADKVLKSNIKNPIFLNEVGLLYLFKEEFSEALKYFDSAVQIDNNYIEAILNGIIVLATLGFYKEAYERYNACIEISQDNKPNMITIALNHIKIAKMYKNLNMHEIAIYQLKEAIKIIDTSKLYIELAKIYLELKDNKKTLDALEEARKLDPKDEEIYLIASQTHLLSGNKEQSKNENDKAILLKTNSIISKALNNSDS